MIISKIKFERLPGLSFNEVYRFLLNGKYYVLRMLWNGVSEQARSDEIVCTYLASAIGISPKVIFPTEKHSGDIIILEYVESEKMKYSDLQEDEIFLEIVNTLQALHESKITFPRVTNIFKDTLSFLNDAIAKGFRDEKIISKIQENLEMLEKKYREIKVEMKPCHCDLNLGNFLKPVDTTFKRKILLIDWESGGQCDPFFDLASFSFYGALREAQMKKLLELYFKKPVGLVDWQHFYLLYLLCFLMFAAWTCLELAIDGKFILPIAPKNIPRAIKLMENYMTKKYEKHDPLYSKENWIFALLSEFEVLGQRLF